MEEIKLKQVGQLEGNYDMQGRVYDPDGLCPAIRTMQGGGLEPKIIAMRGRNPENPSDRTPGAPTKQRLEINQNGVSNTLTTVQKDNMVLEQIAVWDGFNQSVRKDRSVCGTLTSNCGADLKRNGQGIIESTKIFSRPHGFNRGGLSECEVFPTIRNSSTKDGNNGVFDGKQFRIRKLTPKECWRLMGFDDDSFDRAQKVVSNSQLYKQAGNSIVVDVLMAIFQKLL